jgi:hypothetical protein
VHVAPVKDPAMAQPRQQGAQQQQSGESRRIALPATVMSSSRGSASASQVRAR